MSRAFTSAPSSASAATVSRKPQPAGWVSARTARGCLGRESSKETGCYCSDSRASSGMVHMYSGAWHSRHCAGGARPAMQLHRCPRTQKPPARPSPTCCQVHGRVERVVPAVHRAARRYERAQHVRLPKGGRVVQGGGAVLGAACHADLHDRAEQQPGEKRGVAGRAGVRVEWGSEPDAACQAQQPSL